MKYLAKYWPLGSGVTCLKLYFLGAHYCLLSLYPPLSTFLIYMTDWNSVTSRKMPSCPPRRLNSNPQSIWICYYTCQKVSCRCKLRPNKWRDDLLLSVWVGGPSTIIRVLINRRETGDPVSQKEIWQWSSRGLSGPWAEECWQPL